MPRERLRTMGSVRGHRSGPFAGRRAAMLPSSLHLADATPNQARRDVQRSLSEVAQPSPQTRIRPRPECPYMTVVQFVDFQTRAERQASHSWACSGELSTHLGRRLLALAGARTRCRVAWPSDAVDDNRTCGVGAVRRTRRVARGSGPAVRTVRSRRRWSMLV